MKCSLGISNFLEEISSLSHSVVFLYFIPIPKKGSAKGCSNYCTIALISYASKVTLKILQARLQQFVYRELPDVQAGFRKGRETRDQTTTSAGSSIKQETSRKTSTSALPTTPKPVMVWITTNCGKFLNRFSREICMQVKKQQLELGMEQQTGSKSGKEYIKAVYCHPAYLIYMHSTSREMLGWMKHSRNQDCLEKYQ